MLQRLGQWVVDLGEQGAAHLPSPTQTDRPTALERVAGHVEHGDAVAERVESWGGADADVTPILSERILAAAPARPR